MAPRGSVAVNSEQVRRSLPSLENDIVAALLLGPIDIRGMKPPYINLFLLTVILALCNFLASLAGELLHLKLLNVVMHILFPVWAVVGIVVLIIFSYVAAVTYMQYLEAYRESVLVFAYVCLLASVYLPVAIIVGSLLPSFFYISYGTAGVLASIICQRSFSQGRHFASYTQEVYFVVISVAMNLGFYIILALLFYNPG